jgi:hypothetical protein
MLLYTAVVFISGFFPLAYFMVNLLSLSEMLFENL